MNVLVVDDEPGVRTAVERALKLERYDVTLATDGRRALDLLAEQRVDAIILDVSMPDIDGLEVCRRLRLALIHIRRCRPSTLCKSRWAPYP